MADVCKRDVQDQASHGSPYDCRFFSTKQLCDQWLICAKETCKIMKASYVSSPPHTQGEGGGVTEHAATHCNTLHRTASHCITLQHTATRCNILLHTATYFSTLQRPGECACISSGMGERGGGGGFKNE